MTQSELLNKLNELLTLPGETELVEFKEARNDYSFEKLGKYFSALSNEANLKNKNCSWLIFGVNKNHQVVGTNYRNHRPALDSLKSEIANKTTNRITFIEIFEVNHQNGRVVLFQIPAAPPGIPIAWEGHYYGRDGEDLGALNLQEIEQIRKQANQFDWSAQIIPEASISDLDPTAILKAREKFKLKNKNESYFEDIDNWNDIAFLDKAKITVNGKITNSAIILLGKPESTHFISPSVARITWKLESEEAAYEHFDPPFFLTVNNLYQKIRNYNYKILPADSLTPIEVSKYEQWIILEALNNCIAHQDYSLNSRINVIEKPDELIFTNAGKFFEGTLEEYLFKNKTPEKYRNNFLAQAMVNLGMIDTVGHGIKKMFLEQKKRYLPLPEYDFSASEKITLKIYGRVINENYSKLLIEKADLDLYTTFLLDKVQKNQQLTKEESQHLKKQKLVEGRYPNIFVISKIAAITGDKSAYIKNRAFDKDYYKKLIIEYLSKYHSASREDFDKLLLNKLPDILNEKQRLNKIKNLLSELSQKDKRIKNVGTRSISKWILVK
ncbi:MAG: putative DNA binding domain-containing protein [Ignavibacterium album]|uniref:RNA-binding domain-containing protein n=1 Tax=Ignavibacterium album TaxID=591197 RepID=UPI0026F123A4|nr:RNA-binding domain-containing protein [Ignavibacterium album]MBI5662346.1 putative DNA binding domain-containing protein [Ignavibacterium album]